MKARHIALYLALSLLGAGLQAQDDLPQVFSPNAAELGKYGKIPVSYFNGLPNISIPLTELKAKGYTLPVYLTYHASGNKPDQHPGWVGLGWTLHAGGCINRIVNGMKDELTDYEAEDLLHISVSYSSDKAGYIYHAAGTQSKNWDNESRLDSLVNACFYQDHEPDEFQVCLEGINASFYITGENKVKIVSGTDADFCVEWELCQINTIMPHGLYPANYGNGNNTVIESSSYTYISGFTLTNHDGTRYLFGRDEKAIEFTTDLYGDVLASTPNTWLLSSIETPEGEMITFHYEKEGVNIIKRDVRTSWTYTEYGENASIPHSYDSDSIQDEGIRNSISFSLIQPSYLASISCRVSGDSLSFSRSRTTEAAYNYTETELRKRFIDFNSTNGLPFALVQDADHYCQLTGITHKGRQINFGYTESTDIRLHLLTVEIGLGTSAGEGGRYSFKYNEQVPFPGYNSKKTDKWNFYNDVFYGNTSFVSMESVRVPDHDKMQLEIMTRINYPTGGYSLFEYEPHSYSKVMRQFPFEIRPVNSPQDSIAGGLRIKQITDVAADGKSESRCFSYEGSNGRSSGILSGCPKYHAAGRSSGTVYAPYSSFFDWNVGEITFFGMYQMGSELPLAALSATNGNHVTYSQITESVPGNGRTIYRYSNHSEEFAQDVQPRSYENFDKMLLVSPFNSRQLFRGLLLSKRVYGNDNRLDLEEEYTYHIDTLPAIKSAGVGLACGGWLKRVSYARIYSDYPFPDWVQVSSYPDDGGTTYVKTTEYAYDDHRRLKETKRTVGGAQERETITYTGDYDTPAYAGMKVRNMTAYPVEHLKFRKDTVDEKVVSAELTTWKHSDSLFVPAAKYRASLGSGVPLDTTGISGFRPFRKDTMDVRYGDGPELAFTKYDAQGNLVLSRDRTGLPTTYEWTPDGCHPAAIFTGAARGYEYRDSSDVVRYQQNDLTVGDRLNKNFESMGPFTMTLDLMCPLGQNWHLDVIIDGNSYPLTVINSFYTQSVWSASNYGQYPSTRQIPIPAGTHHLGVFVRPNYYYAVQGSDPIGCTLMFSYAEKQYTMVHVPGKTTVFEDFEEDGNNDTEAWHSGRSHVGPWSCPLESEDGYVMDYRVYRDGRWDYVRQAVSGATASINEGTAPIDHVRVYPAGTLPESYTWDDAGNLLSRTDARGITESYRYDGLGRLVGVYDNEGKLVEGYEYNYQNR